MSDPAEADSAGSAPAQAARLLRDRSGLQRADLPFYYSLASTFPIADRYFASVLGQTFPNRRYLMAATSIGQVDDTNPAPADYPAGGTIFDRLDLRRPAFRTPPLLAAPLLATDPGALACDTKGPGVIPPPGSVTGRPCGK